MLAKKRIVTIIGARPQIIKSSAVSRAIRRVFSDQLVEVIVHTGQHYDEDMSEVFFREMEIPSPHFNLHVGSGSHGTQTSKMIEGLEKVFLEVKPDAVLVYGDTNSTLAGALAASKIHVPVIHIEAGLRSFNKSMPEEINRITCDHVSTLLFTPTLSGLENLKNEGFKLHDPEKATIDHPKVFHCGDVMYDNSRYFSTISDHQSNILDKYQLTKNEFILATIHRDSNTDIPQNLEEIFSALLEISDFSGLKIMLPLHPRTKAKMKENLTPGLFSRVFENELIEIIPPAGFLDIIALEKNCKLVITDSGGLQKEAYFFKKPCIILRSETEWIEIVESGNAIVAGARKEKVTQAFHQLISKKDLSYPDFFGDGHAAEFICSKIVENI